MTRLRKAVTLQEIKQGSSALHPAAIYSARWSIKFRNACFAMRNYARSEMFMRTLLAFVSRFYRRDYNFWRCLCISNVAHQINEDIRDSAVRLIDENGEQLGIVPLEEAMRIAVEKDLDLVKIAPGVNPPVCKVMDYGKYRFEQAKRDKEAKKNQHIVEVKEIRLSPGIGENDFNVKLRNGRKFLTDGNRLKVSIRFRGREMAHTYLGEALMLRYAQACEDIADMDRNPKLDGRNMTMFLTAKPPAAAAKAQASPETTETAE